MPYSPPLPHAHILPPPTVTLSHSSSLTPTCCVHNNNEKTLITLSVGGRGDGAGGAGLLTSAPSTSNMQICTIVCRSSTASHSSVTVLPLSLKLPYNRERDWRLVQSLSHKEQAWRCSRPLCLSFCHGKLKKQIDSVHNLICCHVSPHWSCPLWAEAFPALLSPIYHPIACISNLLRRYSRDNQDLQSKGYVTEEGSQTVQQCVRTHIVWSVNSTWKAPNFQLPVWE